MLSKLKNKLAEKALEFADIGDFNKVEQAIEIINKIPGGENSQPGQTIDESIFQTIASLGYDSEDMKFLKKGYTSVADAAKFTEIPEKLIRDWCHAGEIMHKAEGSDKRRVFRICPRSVILRMNEIKDPRLK